MRVPVWVTECGASSFGAEEIQVWGLDRTAELLIGRAPRIHWYSLFDLPRTWGSGPSGSIRSPALHPLDRDGI